MTKPSGRNKIVICGDSFDLELPEANFGRTCYGAIIINLLVSIRGNGVSPFLRAMCASSGFWVFAEETTWSGKFLWKQSSNWANPCVMLREVCNDYAD
jgi:hypothetical protein